MLIPDQFIFLCLSSLTTSLCTSAVVGKASAMATLSLLDMPIIPVKEVTSNAPNAATTDTDTDD